MDNPKEKVAPNTEAIQNDQRKKMQAAYIRQKRAVWFRIAVYGLFCALLLAGMICGQIAYPWATALLCFVLFICGADVGANRRIVCPWLFG